MKRATVTIPEDLDHALERYIDEQSFAVQRTSLIRAALREFLRTRGYVAPSAPLRIRPSRPGGVATP